MSRIFVPALHLILFSSLPLSPFFFFLYLVVEFLFLDRFLAFGFDRVSISFESARKQIFGGQRNCREYNFVPGNNSYLQVQVLDAYVLLLA